ncbi:glucoamylase [Marmoricola endophyticus]|uniref:Glucoamylase n=1 Tax=Marmoricola endophyticus TaxID=2040280 RepID=A0A917BM78_9ACTN|nr:glycoside hydrolase family 15 protein [Marmoricola endophyticus]GGF46445.1 glucoamylase [Marmoricola endophyticus]
MADREQLPIAEHGLIGDLRTCALVGSDGTIDWFCAPRFDSPSIFASVLDDEKGGDWRIHPKGEVIRTQQYYFPDTNILVTRFLTDHGVTELHDFMPVMRAHDEGHRQRLVRRVVAVRGSAELAMRMAARPDYGRADSAPDSVDGGVRIVDGDVAIGLTATVDLVTDGRDVTAEVALEQGGSALFVLEVLEPDEPMQGFDERDVERLFDRTAAFWRDWLSHSTYTGRWRERVDRSALTLKLMCHEPTGGIIASPTTSLPEHIGGGRNWDYRYVWIRDAAFSLYALLRLGFTEEAAAFVAWLSRRLGETPSNDELGPLRVLYDLDGNVPTEEHELEHLSGYRDSRPVRVGNAAVEQLQLDIYGELIDSVYLFNKYGPGLSHDAWTDLLRIVDWLVGNWDRDDAGMWEVRDEPKAHTTSRLMEWVALERMIRVARQRGLPGDLARWAEVRDKVYERIMTHSWDAEVGAFMQHEGSATLDAGVLLMPMVKFVAPNDPRFLSTLDAVEKRLVTDSLVFRYDTEESTDGVGGEEGTFSLCSFWYVEALTRAGRVEDARLALEKMFTYANHLGLYAEQIGLSGEQLGNFPQAFTHLSLISAALNLDRALG